MLNHLFNATGWWNLKTMTSPLLGGLIQATIPSWYKQLILKWNSCIDVSISAEGFLFFSYQQSRKFLIFNFLFGLLKLSYHNELSGGRFKAARIGFVWFSSRLKIFYPIPCQMFLGRVSQKCIFFFRLKFLELLISQMFILLLTPNTNTAIISVRFTLHNRFIPVIQDNFSYRPLPPTNCRDGISAWTLRWLPGDLRRSPPIAATDSPTDSSAKMYIAGF